MPSAALETPEVLAEGVQPDAAIAFWQNRAKLTWDEAKALADGARQRAFYVTGLARQDLVKLISDGLKAALENGETLPEFQERILEAIKAQGWHDYRIETIFRTNLQSAYAAGRYKKMQAVKASRPYWQYLAVMDNRVRPSHAILHEKVYPADHPFWDTNYPPNGFRCRCAVVTLSERQVKAQGLTVEEEMPKADQWTDPKTGMEYAVHFPGADKGFRNNPFKEWAGASISADLQGRQLPAGWDYAQVRALPPAPPDPIETMLGIKRGAPIDFVDAATHANPDYLKARGYQVNCQRCVPTFELRRRGYPVQAMPNDPSVPSPSGITNGNECWQNATIKGYYGNRATRLTKAGLLKELKSAPDGARFGIIWMWPRRKGAHTIACEKVNGQLVFLDPQTGKVGSATLGRADRTTGYSYYRMDDKDFEPGFKWDDAVRSV